MDKFKQGYAKALDDVDNKLNDIHTTDAVGLRILAIMHKFVIQQIAKEKTK